MPRGAPLVLVREAEPCDRSTLSAGSNRARASARARELSQNICHVNDPNERRKKHGRAGNRLFPRRMRQSAAFIPIVDVPRGDIRNRQPGWSEQPTANALALHAVPGNWYQPQSEANSNAASSWTILRVGAS